MTDTQAKLDKIELTYNRAQWRKGYRSQTEEFDYWIGDIQGEIPTDLNGTLFRNGPGMLEVNGASVRHPFDGDGMISRVTFKAGRAHFSNRFVQTAGFVAEQKANKFLYRGVFGTPKTGGWWHNIFDIKFKNIANTQVVYWGKKLLAMWEAAEPHRLDPQTLATLGIEYLNGALAPGDGFAAHPLFDPQGRMVNFGLKVGFPNTTITIYELDIDGNVVEQHAHAIPGFSFIHDFAITKNYCIFFQNPVSFNPVPFLLGKKGAAECVKFQPSQKTKIIIIPRDPRSGEEVRTIETKSGFVFHHVNAFEEDGKIGIDSICYEILPEVPSGQDFRDIDFTKLEPGQLWRFELDLITMRSQRKLIESRCCEFPAINPANVGLPYRYAFMAAAASPVGNAPLQGILKLDLTANTRQFWSAAPTGFMNEPIFIPRPNASSEDDGWVVVMTYDGSIDRSQVVILDGKDLDRGPIATLTLTHHIPYGLHGSWTTETFI
jgi:all-trans-8'-apo-beta-carotenal 15,15'-oxygenase